MVAYAAVMMSWSESTTLMQRFAAVRRTLADLFPTRRRVGATYQGFIKALTRISPRLLARIERHLRDAARRTAATCWTVFGFAVFTVDGTKIDLPRTADHERTFGCAGRDKCGPQALLTCLLHLASGALWGYRIGPARASERGHLRSMRDLLPDSSLLLADAGFAGYDLLRGLHDSGRFFLLRVGGNVRLLRKLGYAKESDATVYLWPDHARRDRQPPLVLRLIRVLSKGRPMFLLTNVLSADRLSDAQACKLYAMRWGIELFYRSLKQTLGRRKMRSDTPVPAALELRWTMVGLALLRLMSLKALIEGGGDPLRLSVAEALNVIRDVIGSLQRRCRRGNLKRRLRAAVQDTYARKTSKRARSYAQKKRERPPGPPRITDAKPLQVQRAQQLARSDRAA